MRKYFKPLALLLSLFLWSFTGCNNNDGGVIDEDMNAKLVLLAGSWQWVQSTGSIAGVTITPESSGKQMEIEFTNNHVFNKKVDEQLVYTSPFILKIEGDKTIITYTTLALFEGVGLGFDHQVEQELKVINSNKLLLIDPCCDNFTFEFIRKE